MVAFLKKPTKSVGFTEIVDFLKSTSLRYALTHNATINDSLVKQFWQTATARTIDNGNQELVATINGKVCTITEASVRSKLQLADATGASLDQADEATTISVRVETEGATTTTTGLDAGLDSGNIHESPLRSHEAPLPKGHTSGSAEDSLQLKELMAIIPKLVTKIDNLEKELKETKQTLRNVVLTLVKKVKSLEVALKRKTKKVVLSDSEDEETKNQERKIQGIDDDPLVSLVRDFIEEKEVDFVTPTKVSASGEAQEEDISPTIFEAAKTLSKVASQSVSTYKRRARSADKGKDIGNGLDFFSAAKEKLNSAEVKVNTGRVEVNPGRTEVNTGVVQTVNATIPSLVKGQREGKSPMTVEVDEEAARQVHLDALLAKRIQEKQEISEQQQKRKAEVQEVAQYYTKEDLDTIRAKLEANAELTKSL
ncbi:hypothetical protein Tco_0835830 [Tanacetum coccineum]